MGGKWARGGVGTGQRVLHVMGLLDESYPGAKIALKYSNPLELLVAVMLSAQCTDVMVNKVTEEVFRKYRSLEDYIRAPREELERDIRSTGFFRQKAKNIQATARMLKEEHGGEVPASMEELTRLPGVARKTANIVLYNAFGVQAGIAVDTHVRRLSQRLGLSRNRDPDRIERDLMSVVPEGKWGHFTYLLIEHGRAVCGARRPRCDVCVLSDLCPRIGVERPGKK